MMSKDNSQKYTLWLLCIAAVTILSGLGLRDPWPPDEPRFALMAKEMWETGNWFFPHRGGEIYPDKPPMVMWMILLFYGLLGNLKLAFLLPSAILSMATLWMTCDIAKRLWNPKIGFYAGFLLAITLHFILQAKSGQLDAPVAFWVMLGCYGLLRHLILGPAWGWYYLSFFAMGMGIITKGVGFLPILMLFGLFLVMPSWCSRKNRQIFKWLSGIIFLLLAVGLWLVPMLIMVEMNPTVDVLAYRDNILLKQTVNRYGSSWAHIQPFYYYILNVIPLFWLPLSLFIPWMIIPIKQAFADKEAKIIYPLSMVIFGVLFFSMTKGKRAEYMLPLLPMFVLVVAPSFEALVTKKSVQKLFLLLVLSVSIVSVIIGLAGMFDVDRVSKITSKYQVNMWYWMTTLGFFGLVVFVYLRNQAIKMYAVFVFGMWVSYGFWAAPLANKAMSTQPMMEAIADIIPEDAEIALVGMREKLLLHTKWKTYHFGHHHPKADQQQAAINWVMKKTNRYLLVNKSYINECLSLETSTGYESFHSRRWLLINRNDLDQIQCQSNALEYDIYTKH